MAPFPDDPEATDDLEPEYDFRSLRGVVRGKYAERAAGSDCGWFGSPRMSPTPSWMRTRSTPHCANTSVGNKDTRRVARPESAKGLAARRGPPPHPVEGRSPPPTKRPSSAPPRRSRLRPAIFIPTLAAPTPQSGGPRRRRRSCERGSLRIGWAGRRRRPRREGVRHGCSGTRGRRAPKGARRLVHDPRRSDAARGR